MESMINKFMENMVGNVEKSVKNGGECED